MTVHRSRESLSKDEIKDILRTNAQLFKRDPQFVEYIVDLAVYLLEHHYEELVEKRRAAEAPIELDGGAGGHDPERAFTHEEVLAALKQSSANALADRYRVLRSAVGQPRSSLICAVCGTMVTGGRKCPNCGNMLG